MKIIIMITLFTVWITASVDINSANVKEMSSLSGVSSKKAQAIVDYRTKHGCFLNVDGLVKVKGIGKKTLEKNRKNLKSGKCKK